MGEGLPLLVQPPLACRRPNAECWTLAIPRARKRAEQDEESGKPETSQTRSEESDQAGGRQRKWPTKPAGGAQETGPPTGCGGTCERETRRYA